MSTDTAYLVDWTEGVVPAGCSPYPQSAMWAEPDLEDAARLMRYVHEHPGEAKDVGRRAQHSVATTIPRNSGLISFVNASTPSNDIRRRRGRKHPRPGRNAKPAPPTDRPGRPSGVR